MSNVISCRKLSKTFMDGDLIVPVLNQVDLDIKAGELVAIVGVSGAGKSTLLQLMGGLDQPTSGEVYVNDQALSTMSERAIDRFRNHNLGFIYQFHHLLPEFNATENVAMPLLIQGKSPKVAMKTAREMLQQVHLGHRLEHRVGELSGGERQRVAIARALVTQPQCVLADEPTGNLDQMTANEVFDIMLHLNQSLGISFVIVTHNLDLVAKMQRVCRLDAGRLV